MKNNMRIVLVIMLFVNVHLYAQVSYDPKQFDCIFSTITDKNKKGIYKAQKVKGKTTGAGMYKSKNDDIYIGDFKDKDFSGLGMMLTSENDTISNCPKAKYYVGRFRNGIKNGKGSCYDVNGELVYFGRFLDDKPVDEFKEDDIRYFSEVKSDKFHYIGELEGNQPNGFGVVIYPDGDYLISKFIDGNRVGISTYMFSDGNWESESVEGDKVTMISSSEEYSALESKLNAAFKENMNVALGYLSQAIQSTGEAISIAKNLGSSNTREHGSALSDVEDAGFSNSGNKKSTQTGDKNNMSEQRAYNNDKSTYSRYDSMLSQAFAGNREASASEINNWQSKMKRLRKKWEDKGKNFPHSSNEDR